MSENTSETSIYASTTPIIRCKRSLCGEPFTPKRKTQHFCSKDCRLEFHKDIVEAGKLVCTKGKSHYAKLANSPRLQRVLKLLSDNTWYSTRDIIYKAYVCNPNTCAWELRCNGFEVKQEWRNKISGYRLKEDL